MTAYLINISLLLFFGIILFWLKPSKNSGKIFCVLASLQWVLLSGLRHITIGADTYAYKHWSFDLVPSFSWGFLWDRFVEILFYGGPGKDPGYFFFVKTFQIFSNDYQIYLIFIALFFHVALGIWIYRNSKEPLISFLIYSCLFYAFFAITGHRQTIATALVVLIGYKFIKERRLLPFLGLTLLAYPIHASSLVFFPFYFLANKKITKKHFMVLFSLMPLLVFFRFVFMLLLVDLFGYEEYAFQYIGAGALNFTLLLFLISILVLLRLDIILKNNINSTHYINAMFVALIFIPLVFINPSAMRVLQYFSIFIMLLVPEIIKSFKHTDRAFAYCISITILISLHIRNNPQYLFFWQG